MIDGETGKAVELEVGSRRSAVGGGGRGEGGREFVSFSVRVCALGFSTLLFGTCKREGGGGGRVKARQARQSAGEGAGESGSGGGGQTEASAFHAQESSELSECEGGRGDSGSQVGVGVGVSVQLFAQKSSGVDGYSSGAYVLRSLVTNAFAEELLLLLAAAAGMCVACSVLAGLSCATRRKQAAPKTQNKGEAPSGIVAVWPRLYGSASSACGWCGGCGGCGGRSCLVLPWDVCVVVEQGSQTCGRARREGGGGKYVRQGVAAALRCAVFACFPAAVGGLLGLTLAFSLPGVFWLNDSHTALIGALRGALRGEIGALIGSLGRGGDAMGSGGEGGGWGRSGRGMTLELYLYSAMVLGIGAGALLALPRSSPLIQP
jgi:hypothetical protein